MWFLEADEQVFTSRNQLTGTCGNCGNPHAQYQRKLNFARAAFVPVFPIGVSSEYYCYRCNHHTSTRVSEKGLIPWHAFAVKFIGLLALTLSCFYAVNQWQQTKAREIALLTTPEKYDFYLIDNNTFNPRTTPYQAPYLLAKVIAVNEDNITIKLSNYQYRRKNDLKKAVRADYAMSRDYFAQNPVSIKRSDLIALSERGAIYEAHRPQNLALFGGMVLRPARPKMPKTYKVNPDNAQAIRLYQSKEFAAAYELFKKAAEQGDGWAQFNLAKMYRDGEGVQANQQQADFWFNRAAARGVIQASQN